jgi:hypothetical protein
VPESRFEEPENFEVFVCQKVAEEGAAILYVSHDESGDWQFLCGHGHTEDGPDGPVTLPLKEVVERDPSINHVAHLPPLGSAERDAAGQPWRLHDGIEDIIHRNVDEYGCHVMRIAADEEGPGFAYSIGVGKTFHQPELVCFGLDDELLPSVVNEVCDRMADGERFTDGGKVPSLIAGRDCVLRRVERARYADFLPFARWFYGNDDFEVLQIVWPDEHGRYPWDEGFQMNELQPHLWEAASV